MSAIPPIPPHRPSNAPAPHRPSNVRRSDARRAYLLEHPLALAIALGIAVSGFVTIALPEAAHTSALYVVLPLWAGDLWGLMCIVGGISTAAGMIRLSPRLEVAGWHLIAAAQAVNVYAILDVRGAEPAFVSGVGLYVAIGATVKAWLIARRAQGAEPS